jgi:uncharacterized membrane protein
VTFERAWILVLVWVPLAWGWYEWPRTLRKTSLALKVASFTMILLALAQPRVNISTTKVALGVLVDTSASVSGADLDRASKLASALDSERGRNWMRVFPFARNTRKGGALEIDRPWRLQTASGDAGHATDLEAAIREASASLPPGMLPRLALISDGHENKGSIARAAWQAKQFGIPIDTFAMAGRPKPALRLESVSLPVNAFTGEPFPIDLMVSAPKGGPAEVELSAEGHSLGKSSVSLSAGVNQIRMHTSVNAPGALDLSIAVRAPGAGEMRVDQAMTLRRPKLLYLSPDPVGVDGHMTETLTAAQFDVQRAAEWEKQKLSDYQLVVFNNWDLKNMPDDHKDEVERFVKQGGGALVIGGERNVYLEPKKDANGKPLEDAVDRVLPARLLPPRSEEGTVVVLIIDKSSSMEGPKMELAKSAATGAVANLRPIDQVGVLIFDNSHRWTVPIRHADDQPAIQKLIAGITPDGGTQIAPALTEAYNKVLPTMATYRHILLLTDGISEEGNSYQVAADAKKQNVTISTIGLGADVHKEYLERVAKLADGKFYFVKDPSALEQVVLKDVAEHTGTTAEEKEFKPEILKKTEILDGVGMESAPILNGFVRFESKPSAETILRVDGREPLLSRWQYGLGRTAIFASDAKTRWATEWVAWKGYDKFWTNLCRDLLPHTQAGESTAEYDSANGDLVVNYRLGPGIEEPEKLPAIFVLGPNGFNKQIEVAKSAAGTYVGRLPIGSREGLFRVRPLDDSRAFPEVGLYRPEVELNEYGSNADLLKQIAAFTGGRFEPSANAVFDAGARSVASSMVLWPGLLGLALALSLAELVNRKGRALFQKD